MQTNSSVTPSHGNYPTGVAIVIGGSGGIGKGICLALAAKGAQIALSYRSSAQAAQQTVREIEQLGQTAEAFSLELSSLEQVSAALIDLQNRYHCIHTLVFAAGADITMTFVGNIDPAEWYRTMNNELNGFFHVIKAVLPLMRQTGGGSIVAITTAGLDRHPPLDILSTAPKAGIEALVRGIAREEGRYNIRANCVAPGVVDGGLFDRLKPQVKPEFIEAMKRNTALKRFGTIEEIAGVAAFLTTPAAAYVTGQHLCVDGGYSV
jgi:NAD(P)-dependent dehydrogenase (short-subunit alcohol dehydrogenase family)